MSEHHVSFWEDPNISIYSSWSWDWQTGRKLVTRVPSSSLPCVNPVFCVYGAHPLKWWYGHSCHLLPWGALGSFQNELTLRDERTKASFKGSTILLLNQMVILVWLWQWRWQHWQWQQRLAAILGSAFSLQKTSVH